MKAVKVYWSYPVMYENILRHSKASEKGIYYISRVYGKKETLLYIGKTNGEYYKRLNHHEYWIKQYKGKILVRLGVIVSPSAYDDSLLADVESALIYEMQPFENTDKMKSYQYTTEYKIQNTGFRGKLKPAMSMRDH